MYLSFIELKVWNTTNGTKQNCKNDYCSHTYESHTHHSYNFWDQHLFYGFSWLPYIWKHCCYISYGNKKHRYLRSSFNLWFDTWLYSTFILQIKAVDNGRPQKSSTCRLHIEWIPKPEPSTVPLAFDEPFYSFSVMESDPVAHMVGVITMDSVDTPVWFEITGTVEVNLLSLLCVLVWQPLHAKACILISVFVITHICYKLKWLNLLMRLSRWSFFAWINFYLCVYLLNRTGIIWLNSLHPLPVPLSFNQSITDNLYFLSLFYLFSFFILEWFGFFCFSPPAFLLLFVSLLLFLALEEDIAAKELFYIVQMACDLNCTAEGICRRSPNTTVRGQLWDLSCAFVLMLLWLFHISCTRSQVLILSH